MFLNTTLSNLPFFSDYSLPHLIIQPSFHLSNVYLLNEHYMPDIDMPIKLRDK